MEESFGVTMLLVMVVFFFLFRFIFLWYWKKTAINTKVLRDRLAPDETQDLV